MRTGRDLWKAGDRRGTQPLCPLSPGESRGVLSLKAPPPTGAPSGCTDLRPKTTRSPHHPRPLPDTCILGLSPAPTPLPAVWTPVLSPHTQEGLFQPHSTGSPSPAPDRASSSHTGAGRLDATRLQGLSLGCASPYGHTSGGLRPSWPTWHVCSGPASGTDASEGNTCRHEADKAGPETSLEVLEGLLGRQGWAVAYSRRKNTGGGGMENMLFIFFLNNYSF